MKKPTSLFVAFLIGTVMFMASSTAFAQAYLYDLLAKPSYSKSWNALLLDEKNVDAWLARYAKTQDGPATPGKPVKLGGVSYQINSVCKTHDCDRNMFYVLYAPNGTQAWGLLLKEGKPERFFGKPDETQKNALRAAAKQ
jgi:Inhibitor of vertebrate lysozyme (Ivy)